MIPRIIHQTWKTRDVPKQFLFFQKTWQTHHPEWEYRFWTDEDSRELVAHHYPAFLGTYDAYRDPICRVDAFRYLVLKHYGGVYADLDFECLCPLDPLLEDEEVVLGLEPASHVAMHWQTARLNRIVCNAFIASTTNHPFWDHVIAKLIESSRHPGPLDATGPFFLTRALDVYPHQLGVRVLPSELIYPADTWDCGDGRLFDMAHWQRLTRRAYAIHHWVGTWYRDQDIEHSLPSAQAPTKLFENGRLLVDAALQARDFSPAQRPLVSCMMVTQNRPGQAREAIRCFQRQTYSARELVIVDDGEDESLADWVNSRNDERIRYERLPQTGTPLGELRNRAVALTKGEYVCQWDDDDLADPARIESQLTTLLAFGADACLLQRWLIWWPQSQRLAVSAARPWEGSLLCTKARLPRYPEERRQGEDTPVIEHLLRTSRMALLDQARLYLYVVHQGNTFDQGHFDRHWESATARFENEEYQRAMQELRKRVNVDAYLDAIGRRADNGDADSGPSTEARARASRARSTVEPTHRKTLRSQRHRRGGAAPKVLILTPIKNASRFITGYFENLLQLDFPRENLSLALLEGDSEDDTWPRLQESLATYSSEFGRTAAFRLDLGLRLNTERWQPHIQFQRRSAIARCRNRLFQRAYQGEDWVLWIDADVIEYPSGSLNQLLAVGKSIVAPHCVQYPGGPTFDLNSFRFKPGARQNRWKYLIDGVIQPPRGDGRVYLEDFRGDPLVELDSVGGTMLLVHAGLHADGILFTDFGYRGYLDTEGFAMHARDRGIQSWGLPDLEIIHTLD
jgi:glycosyltransferase involved in cell wall biosynthesis